MLVRNRETSPDPIRNAILDYIPSADIILIKTDENEPL